MNLNDSLRQIDRRIYIELPHLSAATPTTELSDLLFDIMTSAHLLAVSHCQRARRDRRHGYIEFSDSEISRILKGAFESDKNALKKFYGSIARSVSSNAMSRVREQMLKSTRLTIQDKPSDEKVARAALGRPKVKRSSPVLETVLRTQAALAYNAAAWVENAQDEDLWGYEYTTAGDERVRGSHQDLDGVRYPVDHPFWKLYAPVNGWNCRCALTPIYRGDRKARIKPYRGTPDVDPAFRVNFGGLFVIAA